MARRRRRRRNPQAEADQVKALVARMTEDDGYADELVARDLTYFSFRGPKELAEARRQQVRKGEID